MLPVFLGAFTLGLLWAMMTIAVYISYRVLGLADLTAEGSLSLGAALAARAIHLGCNPYGATLLAVLGGQLAGLATGLLHTRLKIPSLLAGILSMIALYSLNLRVLGRANLSLLRMETVYTRFPLFSWAQNNSFTHLIDPKTSSVLILALLAVLGTVAFLSWFFATEMGCALRAAGDNPQMARAQGINTDAMILGGLLLSNGLIAFSGALLAQQQNYADVQMGTGAIVIGLASLIIGEALFRARTLFRRLISLVLGAVLYRLIIALVLELGMPPQDLKLFTALTVALALTLPHWKSKFKLAKKEIAHASDPRTQQNF